MVPDLKIFLDVDDLQSGRGAAEVAKSSQVVVFLADGYFTRPNTMRELLRAITSHKPIVAVFDEHSAYMSKAELESSISMACLSFSKWGLDDDLRQWGAKPPTAAAIVKALTERPLLWTRNPPFLDVTLRECVAPLVQPKGQQLSTRGARQSTFGPQAPTRRSRDPQG